MAGEMSELARMKIGQAVISNSLQQLQFYLKNGEDPLFKDRKGNTYIHFVCTMYRPYIFHILADTGINICAQNRHGNTALHVTALQEECGHVGDLMAAGIDPDIKNKDEKTAAELKVKNKYWQMSFIKYQPGIFQAVKVHNVEKVLELLHCWCHIDAVRNGQKLRQFAAALKYHDIVWILDEHRPTMEAIFGVLEVNHSKTREALKRTKCNINYLNKASHKQHILQHALRLQDLDLVSMICQAGADVNIPVLVNSYYWGPLFFEAINSKLPLEITWKVLKSGPDFSLKDERGRNALIFSLDKSNGQVPLDVIDFMLKNGAYIAERDETGSTVRDVARFARRRDVVDLVDKYYIKIMRRSDVETLQKLAVDGYDGLLIQHNHRDSYIYACGNETDDVLRFIQWLPGFQKSVKHFHQAVMEKTLEDVQKIIENHDSPNLLINAKDKGGRTPLHLAVLCEKKDVITFLLSHPDININCQDCCCRSAYHFAYALGDRGKDIRNLLTEAGINTAALDSKAEEYKKNPALSEWIKKEKMANYGMELELKCLDKYEELRRIIKSRKKGLKDFEDSIKYFNFPITVFPQVLCPVVPEYKDLIFLAIDCQKEEIALRLADLGADLSRTEVYKVEAEDNVSEYSDTVVMQDADNQNERTESDLQAKVEYCQLTSDIALTAEQRACHLNLTDLANVFKKKMQRQLEKGGSGGLTSAGTSGEQKFPEIFITESF